MHLRKPKITLVFRFEPGLEMLGGIFLLPQQLFNTRESTLRGGGARSDSLISAVEVVPGQGLHVGAKDEVCVALPYFKLMLLRRVYRPAHDLKNIRGGAAMAVLNADGNTDDDGSAEFASGVRRNRSDKSAVRETTRADLDGFEQPREGATRPDGVHKIALREHHGFSGGQVRGYHRKRNAKVLKLSRFEHPLDQILQALIAGQAEARNAPTGDVPEAQRAAGLNNVRERCTTGIGSAQDAPHTSSRDVRDGDMVLFEDLQNTQVCEAARETSAKR